MEAQNKIIKPAKFNPDPGEDNENNQTSRCVEHDYPMEVSQLNKREREGNYAPPTPNKTPAEKKTKSVATNATSVANETILRAILTLEKRVEEQLVGLKEQARQSGTVLASLTKAMQFNTEEVQGCKKKIKKLEDQNAYLKKEANELKERVRDQERYRMRWCLRIKGLEEKEGEDICGKVIHILQAIAPGLKERMRIQWTLFTGSERR